MVTHRYSSSLREVSVEQTLAHAQRIAPLVGITRVTETTCLDRIGVPVFASIRPRAMPGSLCVSAGKGLTADEARIGAYMEAIELAYVEPHRSQVQMFRGVAGDLLDAAARPEAIFELCPVTPISATTPLHCCHAFDIRTGEQVVVPAERVLYPILPRDGGGLFGSDGNGVASGNTLDEATLHGMAEVIERDVQSFMFPIEARSHRVDNATLPEPLKTLAARLDRDGFDLYIRYAPNVFELPYFTVGLIERGVEFAGHRGDGLHPASSIAVTRAVCEAIQSRLTDIHGGRDDLSMHRYQERPPAWAAVERTAGMNRWVDRMSSTASGTISFSEIPDGAADAPDVPSGIRLLLERLDRVGCSRVFRAVHTPPDSPLVVVRIIVPRLECYLGEIPRVGPRLKEYFEHGPQVLTLRRPDAP